MMWVVTANTNTCRMYDYDKKSKKLDLLREIQHPENRQKTISELLDFLQTNTKYSER